MGGGAVHFISSIDCPKSNLCSFCPPLNDNEMSFVVNFLDWNEDGCLESHVLATSQICDDEKGYYQSNRKDSKDFSERFVMLTVLVVIINGRFSLLI